MRMRITIILMIAIGGLVLLSTGAVLLLSATANVQNTLELTRVRALLTISAVERAVADHLSPGRLLVADIQRRFATGAVGSGSDVELIEVLEGALATAPQLAGAVVWRDGQAPLWVLRQKDGSLTVDRHQDPGTPALADFDAVKRGLEGPEWGTPYYRDGQSYMTVSAPLIEGGKTVGVVSSGISLRAFSQFLVDLAVHDAIPFVMAGEDHVVAHPLLLDPQISAKLNRDRPLLSTADLGDPALAHFASLQAKDLEGWRGLDLRRYETDGTDEVILSRTSHAYGDTPWQIGVHLPFDDATRQIQRLFGSIMTGLGLLVVSILAGMLMARRIARPVHGVSLAASQIERLELDDIPALRGSRIRELDELSRAFNRMVQGLRWFTAYTPQRLVRQLMDGGPPQRDAHAADLTVMFADIAGFTPLSENLAPEAVGAMLNDHFEMLVGAVEAEGGTLDKFIGDAAMAFWGAPEPTPEHPHRACAAALAIASAINAQPASATAPRLKIALHTGPLIVGNVGARTRMNYTIIGDTVNVCARIEALAGEYLGDDRVVIIVSDAVVQAVGTAFTFRPLGDRQVKGRARAVTLWQLTGAGRAPD